LAHLVGGKGWRATLGGEETEVAIAELIIGEGIKSAFKVVSEAAERWLQPRDELLRSAYVILDCMKGLAADLDRLLEIVNSPYASGKETVLGVREDGMAVDFIKIDPRLREISQSLLSNIDTISNHFSTIEPTYSVYKGLKEAHYLGWLIQFDHMNIHKSELPEGDLFSKLSAADTEEVLRGLKILCAQVRADIADFIKQNYKVRDTPDGHVRKS
jgi:hypothetical protein